MLSLVLEPLSYSYKYYCLNEEDNNHTANSSASSALHIETEVSAIKSIKHQLEAITPVNAGSLYWLI